MKWRAFTLDVRPVNYKDIIKNGSVLFELSRKPVLSANYKANGKIYHVGMICLKEGMFGVHEISFVDVVDEDGTQEIDFTCPYCNKVYLDAFELDDDGEMECPYCGSKIKYSREVTVEYIVTPMKRASIRKVN
jgi:uncharacterized Zn-finger protein